MKKVYPLKLFCQSMARLISSTEGVQMYSCIPRTNLFWSTAPWAKEHVYAPNLWVVCDNFIFLSLSMLVQKTVCHRPRSFSLSLLPALKLKTCLWEIKLKICGVFSYCSLTFRNKVELYILCMCVSKEVKLLNISKHQQIKI